MNSVRLTALQIAVEDAVGKLRCLSPDRSQRVLALIEDLAELQALEDKQDREDARAALAEPGEDVPLEQLAKELGLCLSRLAAYCFASLGARGASNVFRCSRLK